MTDNDSNETQTNSPGASPGDDERETREQLEKTGEPNRDELGNADGAS